MSKSSKDCVCDTVNDPDDMLLFLRGIVFLLKECANHPILYDKNYEKHNDLDKKNNIWSQITIKYGFYEPDHPRNCQNECELKMLMRKTRKYFQKITACKKTANISKTDEIITNSTIRQENVSEGITAIGQIFECIAIHPMLYNTEHENYKDETETLAVWNHIFNLCYENDNDFISFDYNTRFAECMLQRIIKPIIYVSKKKPSTTNIVQMNVDSGGMVNINIHPPKLSHVTERIQTTDLFLNSNNRDINTNNALQNELPSPINQPSTI